jgi:hypothetical protein
MVLAKDANITIICRHSSNDYHFRYEMKRVVLLTYVFQ